MFKAMFLIQYSAIKRGDSMQNDNEILNELRIEVAKQKENIDSDYVEILKRIRDENYSKLKNKGGSKLIDKE